MTSSPATAPARAPANPARLLETALLLTWALHGAAMLGMAAFLLPALPGGGVADDAARVAYIAAHPWRFRLGWLPWQLTAASDVLLAVALVRTPWIPRRPAWLVGALTALAVVPDQGGQALWITRGVELARHAARTGDAGPYLRFEAWVFPLTGAWAALLYTLAALGWTWCFAASGAWTRALGWLSALLWGCFLAISVGPLLPAGVRPAPGLVAAGNALGFVLLELWLLLVAEQVMRRARPATGHGRWAPWRHPRAGPGAWLAEVAAQSRVARQACALLPVLEFRSDVTDVVYVSYLVAAARLEALVPPGLALDRLGPGGRYAVFTFLTYRHGGFGPTIAGPLRRLFPSPVQTNWRVHVRDARTGTAGVYFVTTAVTTTLHALGARLMAEGLPMHLLARGEVARDARDGAVRVVLDPGRGSAPDAVIALAPAAPAPLAPPWSECFADRAALLRYLVSQDRALSTQAWSARTTRHEIALGIDPAACEPLAGAVDSRAARAVVGDAAPLCFRVPRVAFRLTAEARDPWTR